MSRAIYFHLKRFDPVYHDFLIVDSLDDRASSKSGRAFATARELIDHWLDKYPDGSVEITAETK